MDSEIARHSEHSCKIIQKAACVKLMHSNEIMEKLRTDKTVLQISEKSWKT